jgi:Fe2+ or Zn2+ uptake regulation protein
MLSCCGKPLINLGEVDFMNCNTNSIERLFCAKCGKIVDICDYTLDDEEWICEADTFEEMKNSEHYKEIVPKLCESCRKLDSVSCNTFEIGICRNCGKTTI